MGLSLLKTIGADPTSFNLETVQNTLTFFQTMLVTVAAFEAFLGLAMAGFQYFTAFGDETKAAAAKKTLYWVIIGMIIIILSQVLVYEVKRFVAGAEPINVVPSLTPLNPSSGPGGSGGSP